MIADPTTAAPPALAATLASVNKLLASHGGGVEAVELDRHGRLRLRFVGMCSSCPCKPLTVAATVRPWLERVPGISEVEVEGARISEEAARRLVELGIAPPPPTDEEDDR